MTAVVGQAASDPASWLNQPLVSGGVLSMGLFILYLFVRRFIGTENGWEKLWQARSTDATMAREDARAARDEAYQAHTRATAAETKAALAEARAQVAQTQAAAAKAEADECHAARVTMEAEIAELRRRLDAVDRPWDGSERRRRQLPPPTTPPEDQP